MRFFVQSKRSTHSAWWNLFSFPTGRTLGWFTYRAGARLVSFISRSGHEICINMRFFSPTFALRPRNTSIENWHRCSKCVSCAKTPCQTTPCQPGSWWQEQRFGTHVVSLRSSSTRSSGESEWVTCSLKQVPLVRWYGKNPRCRERTRCRSLLVGIWYQTKNLTQEKTIQFIYPRKFTFFTFVMLPHFSGGTG